MQDAHYFLRGEKSIGNHANKERRDDGGDIVHQVRIPDLTSGESDASEVRSEGYKPRAPNKKLEEHHQTEPKVGLGIHQEFSSNRTISKHKGTKPRRFLVASFYLISFTRTLRNDTREIGSWFCKPT